MVCNGDYSMFCLHLFEPWAPSSIWCSGPLFSTEEVAAIIPFSTFPAPSRLTVYIWSMVSDYSVPTMARLTVFASAEKYALITISRWPAKVFGRKPSTGFSVNNRAVISREVVIKH